MQQSKTKIPAKKLTFFGFLAMTISMVVSLYEYPTFATSGFSLVFFLLLGGLLWFIPVALCAAEMATVKGWEKGVSQTKDIKKQPMFTCLQTKEYCY